MAPYLIALLLLFLGSFITKKKSIAYLGILFLFVLALFRDVSVGIDTINYVTYKPESEHRGLSSIQVVFYFVYGLLPILGSRTVIVFLTTITFLFLVLSCKRFKISVAYAFFFFVLFDFYNLSLNIMRQYAAISVLLYAYSFIFEKTNKKYLFFVFLLLASSLHTSSLFFAWVYFLRFIDLSSIKRPLLIVLVVGVFLLVEFYLKNNYLSYVSLLFENNSEELASYQTSFDQAEALSGWSIGGMLIKIGMLSINLFIFFDLVKYHDDRLVLVSSLFFASIIVTMFFEQFFGNLGRLRYSLSIINIIAYSYYYVRSKSKYKFLLLMSVLAVYGYQYIWDLSKGSYGTTPYLWMF